MRGRLLAQKRPPLRNGELPSGRRSIRPPPVSRRRKVATAEALRRLPVRELLVTPDPLSIAHVPADEVEHDGTFTDTIGNTADRSIADVADGKDAGHAGFEQVRIAVEFPPRRALAASEEICAGEEEAFTVAAHNAFQPIRMRLRADKDEERCCRQLLCCLSVV